MDKNSDDGRETTGGRVGIPVLVCLLLPVGVVAGGMAYLAGRAGDDEAAAASCRTQRVVALAVPASMLGVVTRALGGLTPECTRVDLSSTESSQVALAVSSGQQPPDVWLADSRFWMTPTYLGGPAGLRVVSPSVASTPIMLVGGPSARQFASWGEAERSGLVSVPDPLSSTTGSLAVIAPQSEAAAVGRSKAEARQMLVPFAQAYGDRVSRGLDSYVGAAWFPRASRRLVVCTQQEYGEARATAPYLRDLTPDVGAPMLEFPLAVRQGAPAGSGAVARGLIDYLASEPGLAALDDAGLGGPAAGPAGQVATVLPVPGARTVASTLQSWRSLSVPSAILAVVDASGSMDIAAASGTRMELLADAAGIGLSFLPSHARVGLWVFSIDKGGPGQDWRVLEPMRRLDDLRFGRTQRYALREWAQDLPSLTDGGTGLYDTALAAYKQGLRDYKPHYSNAVVLLTDGENEDPGSISIDDLVSQLRDLRDPQRPVRIVGIAIGKDADLGALQQMAAATDGDAYLAARPEDILGVFAQAVLSR